MSGDGPMYQCKDCDWNGDEYRVVNDGSTAGTAVCPKCEGQLAIR
ncbi:hypothetical protein SAMN05192561_1253 [Halopenitus malekzadehii]|uniref:Uncharacterized protein n=1 Tax=Halopenitus malekzadehii TaxID=1267564 RepID=A0A1H6JV61_9EURY|nr:hypothetical protein SAMN05192561_1253 [Halopenitus malekzadehii]